MNTKRPVEDTIGVTGCTRGPPSPVTVARYHGRPQEPLGAERGELRDGGGEVGPRSHVRDAATGCESQVVPDR